MKQERFEVKYHFPLDRLEELIAFIKPFMVLDRYSDQSGMIGAYKVQSLYLDSKNLDFYRTHLEGYQSRRKIRIRKYTHMKRSHYFLEIKNKLFFNTNKLRIKLDNDLLKQTTKHRDFNCLCELFLEKYSENKIAEIIHFDILTLKIIPVVFITYYRLAYNSAYEHNIRLTIDYNVEASKASDVLRFKHQRAQKRLLPLYSGILELKANRTIPRWLQDVILEFGLTRTAFSKYTESIKNLYDI
ncbi:MAG: polyphosphate polymerase domain-containing protein [Candidatus Omnitrophota bacterium]